MMQLPKGYRVMTLLASYKQQCCGLVRVRVTHTRTECARVTRAQFLLYFIYLARRLQRHSPHILEIIARVEIEI